MKKLPLLLLPLLLIAFAGCKKKLFDGPNSFSENFESVTGSDQLFPAGESRWSYFQQTMDENYIAIDSTNPHSGNHCLKFFAVKSPSSTVSKCSIVKQHMAFWEGQTVHMEAWYYIEGNASANWLFLFDLEEQAAIGAGPGMRLANVGTDNHLVYESKFYNPTIEQEQPVSFPRDQWVKIDVEIKLAQNKKGSVRVWQNDRLILSKDHCKTLPKDFLYDQQGTQGRYSSIEFGLTANTKDSDMTIYMDDISVYTTN